MLLINGAAELFNAQGSVVYSQPINEESSTPRRDRVIILTTNPSLFIVATQDTFLDTISLTTYGGGDRDDVVVLSPVNNDTIQAMWPASILLSALNEADILQVDDPENFIFTLDDEHCRDIQQAWDLSDWE